MNFIVENGEHRCLGYGFFEQNLAVSVFQKLSILSAMYFLGDLEFQVLGMENVLLYFLVGIHNLAFEEALRLGDEMVIKMIFEEEVHVLFA